MNKAEKLVKGVHHINVNCDDPKEFAKIKAFYVDLLGMEVAMEQGNRLMIDMGNCLLEVFANGGTHTLGTIRHIALDVTDTAACVDKVRAAGYPIKMDVTRIDDPAIIAFCIGPMGEEIEFFQTTNLD